MLKPETSEPPADRDVMQDAWCCLTCYARFNFGRLKMKEDGLSCPACGSIDTAAADGRTYDVKS